MVKRYGISQIIKKGANKLKSDRLRSEREDNLVLIIITLLGILIFNNKYIKKKPCPCQISKGLEIKIYALGVDSILTLLYFCNSKSHTNLFTYYRKVML